MTNIEHIRGLIRIEGASSTIVRLGICPDHGLTVIRDGSEVEDEFVCVACELRNPAALDLISIGTVGLVDTAPPYRLQ